MSVYCVMRSQIRQLLLTSGDGSVDPRANTKHMLPAGGSWSFASSVGSASAKGAKTRLLENFIVVAI